MLTADEALDVRLLRAHGHRTGHGGLPDGPGKLVDLCTAERIADPVQNHRTTPVGDVLHELVI